MSDTGISLFGTAIGRCGIAWGPDGVLAVNLPEGSDAATRARLRRRCPDAGEVSPTEQVQAAIDAMTRLLGGEAVDLRFVTLDMRRVPDFNQRVYQIARTIVPGATLTYGDIAARLDEPPDPELARAVGRSLGQNPFPLVVPCHRVVAAGGKSGGFSAPGGRVTKLRLLAIEGARTGTAPSLFEWAGAAR